MKAQRTIHRITVDIGMLFSWAFSTACLLRMGMYCAEYKGPDLLLFLFFCYHCSVILTVNCEVHHLFPLPMRGQTFWFPPPFCYQWHLTHRAQNSRSVRRQSSVCVRTVQAPLCPLPPLSLSLPQCWTLWCALISRYALRTIVPFCCELIHLPLTTLSSHFNTQNSALNRKQF